MDTQPTNSATELLRVRTWDDYIGQASLKRKLGMRIKASIIDNRRMDHILFAAGPGFGKTSLAGIVANSLGIEYFELKMPIPERQFMRIVQRARAAGRALVLLDEIHSAPNKFQEMLLPAIEDGYLQNAAGKAISVEGITFVGATTEPQKLIKPLIDRFKVTPHFEEYTDDELGHILHGMCGRLGVQLPMEHAMTLAPAAAFTPRIAGDLAVAARDLQTLGEEVCPETILDLADLDPDGLAPKHLAYLRTLDELGGVSGFKNIANMLQYPTAVIEEIERLLIRRHMLELDKTGRCITAEGMTKIGISATQLRSVS